MQGRVKRPIIPAWQNDATRDTGLIREWWGRTPAAMVGLAHRLSGTLALDIDAHDGRPGILTMMRHRLAGADDQATPSFRTATGGEQRILARPSDLAALSGNYTGTGKDGAPQNLGHGLDVILGYSVLPSMTATPGRRWAYERAPSEVIPAGCPDWIVEPIRARLEHAAALESMPRQPAPSDLTGSYRYVAAAIDGEVEAIRGLQPGGLQTGLHRAACNVGRALARSGRLDLAGYAADVLTSAAPWANTTHERATIHRGIEWGMKNG